ncbi:hypothetical protein L9F63_008069, partial [Diploptera punctata]
RIHPGKHGKRLLMRQPRIKKESDPSHPSPDSEPGSPQFISSSNLLNLPPVRPNTSSSNLLTVPQQTYLVKQHSHPLLPSQQSPGPPAPTALLVQRQLSQPAPPPPPLQVHLVAAQVQPPPNQDPSNRSVSPSPSVVIEQLPVLRVVTDTPSGSASDPSKMVPGGGLRIRTDELRRASSSPQASSPREVFEPQRSGHCPVLRPGPALGCNFCWNTIDGHGRILRRKTKYHCPECQTNLCIVPCFQEYHERQLAGGRDTAGTVSPTIMKVLPKTSSI